MESPVKEAKKAIVLGLDGGHPELVQRFIRKEKKIKALGEQLARCKRDS